MGEKLTTTEGKFVALIILFILILSIFMLGFNLILDYERKTFYCGTPQDYNIEPVYDINSDAGSKLPIGYKCCLRKPNYILNNQGDWIEQGNTCKFVSIKK